MARIMIIEDEADLAELYKMLLDSAGHLVEGIFTDPQRPLAVGRGRLQPDIIILDERLGVESGMDYLPRYRSAFPEARILVASADPEAVRLATSRGADGAKKKPFPLGDLLEEIHRLSPPGM